MLTSLHILVVLNYVSAKNLKVKQNFLSFNIYFYLSFFGFFFSAVIMFELFVLVGACLHQPQSFDKNTCSVSV